MAYQAKGQLVYLSIYMFDHVYGRYTPKENYKLVKNKISRHKYITTSSCIQLHTKFIISHISMHFLFFFSSLLSLSIYQPLFSKSFSDVVIHIQAKLITSAEELINSYEPGKLLLIELELDVIPEITFTQSYKGLKVRVGRVRD